MVISDVKLQALKGDRMDPLMNAHPSCGEVIMAASRQYLRGIYCRWNTIVRHFCFVLSADRLIKFTVLQMRKCTVMHNAMGRIASSKYGPVISQITGVQVRPFFVLPARGQR